MGADDLAAVKKKYGFNPEEHFVIPEDVQKHYASLNEKHAKVEEEVQHNF